MIEEASGLGLLEEACLGRCMLPLRGIGVDDMGRSLDAYEDEEPDMSDDSCS